MSFCFQSFNYPSNMNCSINKHASQSQGKRNPALVNLPQAEGRGTESSKDRRFSVPRCSQDIGIGIIGGASVDLSLNFVRKLSELKPENKGISSPFIILCSDPALTEDLMHIRKNSLGKSKRLQTDHSSVVERLRCKRAFLEKAGVCCIVMPCHLSHSWHDQIKERCSVPFLHVGECVAGELKEAKLRPLEAGSPLRIGVLATNTGLVTQVYREKLANEGFEAVLPDKATMEHVVIPAVEAINREDLEGAQNLFRIALQVLLVRAVNRVILASDELRDLLPPEDPLWRKCIDPMDVLVRSTVKYAQSVGRC